MLVSNVNQSVDQTKNSKQEHLKFAAFCEATTIQMTVPTIVLLHCHYLFKSRAVLAVHKYALAVNVKGFPFGLLAHNMKNIHQVQRAGSFTSPRTSVWKKCSISDNPLMCHSKQPNGAK